MRIFGGLFVGVWTTRYLGPSDVGIFSYAFVFIAFFSWASHLGLDQIVVRELTKFPEKTASILGSAFLLKFFGAFLSIALILVSIRFIKPEDELIRLVVFIASLTYIFQAFNVIDFFFQAKVLSKYIVIAKNIAFLISSGLKIYFIFAKFSVIWFVLANLLDVAAGGLLMVYLFVKNGNAIRTCKFDIEIAKGLLLYGWPLMLSSFLISIHMKLDQVMIESILGVKDLGLYSVAVRLSEMWYFIPAIIASTLMPYFVKLREEDKNLYKMRMIQMLSLMFWLGVTVGLITIIFGKKAIVLLFGNEFSVSYYALSFNIWGGIFIAQGLVTSLWLIAEDLQIYRLYVQVFAVILNIVANLVLIPRFGISGAALATFITYFFATWVFGLFFKELNSITLMMLKASSPHYLYRFFKEKIHG